MTHYTNNNTENNIHTDEKKTAHDWR